MFIFSAEDPKIRLARREWLSSAYAKECKTCGSTNWRKLSSKMIEGSLRYKTPRCMTCKSNEQSKNRSNYNATNAAYRARKMNQTPKDADKAIIKLYYERSVEKTRLTGIKHEVDHIHPLKQGGLHHQDNLQVITGLENSSKCDRTRPDVYGERLMSDGSWSTDWLPFA